MGEQPMDSVIQDSVGFDDDQPFTMPTKEDILAMLDTMEISDDEKEQLRDALANNKPLFEPERSFFSSQFLVLVCLLLVVASIFAFFGLKLYKSLKQKEDKRQEKKVQREQKKKK